MTPLSAAALVAGSLGAVDPALASDTRACHRAWSSPELVNKPGPQLSPAARIGIDGSGWAIWSGTR